MILFYYGSVYMIMIFILVKSHLNIFSNNYIFKIAVIKQLVYPVMMRKCSQKNEYAKISFCVY